MQASVYTYNGVYIHVYLLCCFRFFLILRLSMLDGEFVLTQNRICSSLSSSIERSICPWRFSSVFLSVLACPGVHSYSFYGNHPPPPFSRSFLILSLSLFPFIYLLIVPSVSLSLVSAALFYLSLFLSFFLSPSIYLYLISPSIYLLSILHLFVFNLSISHLSIYLSISFPLSVSLSLCFSLCAFVSIASASWWVFIILVAAVKMTSFSL